MKRIQSRRGLRSRFVRIIVAALIPIGLVATIGSAGNASPASGPIVLTAPSNIPGVAPLPYTGVTASSFTIPTSVSNLTVTPNQGVSGTPMTISGSGLAANTMLQLTWSTNSSTWVADVEPNTVNYNGTSYSKFTVNMATVTTDANGAFTYSTTAPADFGGVHDIYAVVNGAAVAHGGFELLRILKISPRSGPVGTPIHITYTSMGASLYTGGASVLWDNHYAGEMMGAWTRGTATVTIRAAGAVGNHLIQIGNAISYMYMNVIQSPIPYTNGGVFAFHVTKSTTIPKPYITWPANVTPTVNAVTTQINAANASTAGQTLDPTTNAVATLSTTRGPVYTPDTLSVTGMTLDNSSTVANGSYNLVWSTVVGNRVNCASTCWAFQQIPLGSATASNGSLTAHFTVPNNLGGYHVVQVLDSSGNIEAQAAFYVKESIVPFKNKAGKVISMGVATANDYTAPLNNPTAAQLARQAAAIAVGQSGTGAYTFHENQEFTISIDGVGWTQLDNTLGVDYDNSYMGYGCGFNSNGYMVIHLHATGGPGIHVIDLNPMLYSLSPSFANTPYGMVPVLSSARDYPGLALGYQVPSIHFAIRVIK